MPLIGVATVGAAIIPMVACRTKGEQSKISGIAMPWNEPRQKPTTGSGVFASDIQYWTTQAKHKFVCHATNTHKVDSFCIIEDSSKTTPLLLVGAKFYDKNGTQMTNWTSSDNKTWHCGVTISESFMIEIEINGESGSEYVATAWQEVA